MISVNGKVMIMTFKLNIDKALNPKGVVFRKTNSIKGVEGKS
jgi:hypothetical protein